MTSQAEREDRLAAFTSQRPYLFAVAYRLLGVAEDAEDVLQDAWLRFADTSLGELASARAYLVTIVTRLALDQLQSARRRRETYVGTWLPEPVRSSEALPEELAERAESASFAFLLLLERLNPLERAVVVLHDVFDFSHEEIGRMTERTTAASRQTLRRARLKLNPPSLARNVSVDEGLVGEVVTSMRVGDVSRLLGLLAPDVVLMSDGGGKVRAINRPLIGQREVSRLLVSVTRTETDVETAPVALNGQQAMLLYIGGVLDSAFVFDVTPAGVTGIYVVRNPDKLARLTRSAA